MSAEHIAVVRADGGLSIVAFCTVGRGNVLPDGARWLDQGQGSWAREATDDLVAAEVKRAVPEMVSWHRVDRAELPTDRTYRDALVHDGKNVVHDMPRAREVHRRMLRHERARAMIELDAQFTRAQGRGDAKAAAAAEAERQRWRDAPADPRIDAAQSVDDLKGAGVAPT